MSPTCNRTSAIVPRFSAQQAQELAARHYDFAVTARELPSYVDQNFHLQDETGAEYVLKISNSGQDPDLLEAQVAALDVLQANPGRLETPRVVRGAAGAALNREGAHAVWLVTYLEGRLLAHVAPQPYRLLRELGRGLGDLDNALRPFDPPPARREHDWDLRHAPKALSFIEYIPDGALRTAVGRRLERFEVDVSPDIDRLPFQVIHNDANDYNLLVRGDGEAARVSGLLDFGDLVRTARVCEPAVAMTYAMMASADPLRAGAEVLAGYHESVVLERAEIRLVPYLIEARLCISVTMSSYRRNQDPENEYIVVSQVPVRRLLDWTSVTPPARWIETFQDACASVRPIERAAPAERATDEA